ncbi:hypothetical protein ABPG72_005054 [Tetrahymena utriculariae]
MKFQSIFYLLLILFGGASAANTLISSGLTDAYRQILLDSHNKLRNKVASGQQSPQPQAANMMAMNWSTSLEVTAQAWANNMATVMTHSGSDKGYGENLAENGSTVKNDYDPASHVQMWFNEVNDATWQTSYINKYVFGSKYGHYSQVIWATSNSLGCGHSYFFDGIYYQHYTVCQYQAQGNYIGQAVYAQGNPCSQCGSQQCNSQYTSLCGTTTPVNTSSNPNNQNPTQSQLLSFGQFMVVILLLTHLIY